MKGTLFKNKNNWEVFYEVADLQQGIVWEKQLPLHPKFESDNLKNDDEIDFEITDEFTHPELYEHIGWGDGISYAKPITAL